MNVVFFAIGLAWFAPAIVGVADIIFWFWTDQQLSSIYWESSRGAFAYFSAMVGVASFAVACKLTD